MITSDIAIPIAGVHLLKGVLSLPEDARGLVIFVHGSGSNRDSPRNIHVSRLLCKNHIATLLIDLLTDEEMAVDEKTRILRFNIDLLAERVISITKYIIDLPSVKTLPIAYYGASTGAAAALIATSSAQAEAIRAVVSRGGRVDLAKSSLGRVRAAVLLLVGGNDTQTIILNQGALNRLQHAADKRLIIVPGAGHNFDEEGTMEEVARHACSWFELHFP